MREEKLYKYIGIRIEEEREKKRINKSEVAKTLDVSRDYINKIEGGRIRIPLHVLLQIAGMLELKVDDLLPEDINSVFPYVPTIPSHSVIDGLDVTEGADASARSDTVLVTDFPAKWALAELLKQYIVALEEAGGNAEDVKALWERVHADVMSDSSGNVIKNFNYRGAGRKKKYTVEQEDEVMDLLAEGKSLQDVSKIKGIPMSTVFDISRRHAKK